eukprot:9483994-Pyramimonas_sp.AAC.1
MCIRDSDCGIRWRVSWDSLCGRIGWATFLLFLIKALVRPMALSVLKNPKKLFVTHARALNGDSVDVCMKTRSGSNDSIADLLRQSNAYASRVASCATSA